MACRTIDVTLGFFNDLIARKEKDLGAEMLIVEADGKIISNSSRISGPIVLKNISELAGNSPFASQVKAGLQNRDQSQRVEFDNNGEAQHLLHAPDRRHAVVPRHRPADQVDHRPA